LASRFKIFAWGALTLYIFVISISLVKGYSFWQQITFADLDNTDSWNLIYNQQFTPFLMGFLFVLMVGISISSALAIMLSIYLRKFQHEIRKLIERTLNVIAFVPCLAWVIIYVPFFETITTANASLNIFWGIITFSSMSLPLLLYLTFQRLNSISDETIELGYALGANTKQIALHLMLPRRFPQIIVGIAITYVRIMIEIVILLMGMKVVPLNTGSITSIFVFILLSAMAVLVFRSSSE
jgi:ABC-type phosphate transport system permease subunit